MQKSVSQILIGIDSANISIIDGMQRTSALIEATSEDASVNDRLMRVEFWLTKNVRSMVYRMLVLNTGQVPWTLSRQLSVVYEPLLHDIKANVPELQKLGTPDDPKRRVGAGQFRSESLVEAYMAFSLRKTNIDAKETLSDEFSRLDFVENLSDENFQNNFYKTISAMVNVDTAFSQYDSGEDAKLSKGRHLFDSQPAVIGFVVAVATFAIGRPGMERPPEEIERRISDVSAWAQILYEKLSNMSENDLADFLKLDVLREILDRKVGQVGRYERSVYADAFQVLIEEKFDVKSMEVCWRAN
jgi:hypothetical protein